MFDSKTILFVLFIQCVWISIANHIVVENDQDGSPMNEWDINSDGDPTLQGFATKMSINIGETVQFKINSSASTQYRIDIYRLGYYRGNGARRVDTIRPFVALPQTQPECEMDHETLLFDCDNWALSAEWKVPEEGAPSGVYVARLVREDDEDLKSGTRTWRTDNSPFGADPRFAIPGQSHLVPPAKDPHAYGALGYGKLRNALKEPRASHIPFVVRDDASKADILFQTSDTTWQAYNHFGGANTYNTFYENEDIALKRNPLKKTRALVASYNRPFATRAIRSVNYIFGSEYAMIRFLEKEGYSVSYASGYDVHRQADLLSRFKMFISIGHDEYWSGQQRTNVERARDEFGTHLSFLSGNEMFWRIRFEKEGRIMACYKETQSLVKLDPVENEWTGTFRDARSINPLGPQPENAVTGVLFTVNAWRHDPLRVPAFYGRLRFWRHTDVRQLYVQSTMKPELRLQSKQYLKGILGHEWDEDIDNGFRPQGLIHMSETTVDNVMYIQNHGSIYDSGSATHHLVAYRHPKSRAIVFGAGTVQWAWGLDEVHDSDTGVPAHVANVCNIRLGVDPEAPVTDIQQATVNMFADMNVFPANLSSHLHFAESSTDIAPPSSNIPLSFLSNLGCEAVIDKKQWTEEDEMESDSVLVDLIMHINAQDTINGGQVGGVEVRVPLEEQLRNETNRWHPANRLNQPMFHAQTPNTIFWEYRTQVTRGQLRQHLMNADETLSWREICDLGQKHTTGDSNLPLVTLEVYTRATDDSYNTESPKLNMLLLALEESQPTPKS